jgi:hypothetical protein
MPELLAGSRGTSLTELMIGISISTIVILGAGSLLSFAMTNFVRIVDQNSAEEELLTASYILRTVATQAVDLYGVAAITAANQGGQIINVNTDPASIVNDFTSVGAAADEVFNIAAFKRQISPTVANTIPLNDSFRETGIFFKAPAADCVGSTDNHIACSGNLVITMGDEPGGPAATVLDAMTDGFVQRFHYLVSMQVRTTTVLNASPSYAKEAVFFLTVRYFISGNRTQYNYLPVPPANGPSFRDKSMEVFVGFRNNYLGPSQLVAGDPERLHGSLYYFPFKAPSLGSF